MKVEVLGVHLVEEAPDPCHLVELRLDREEPDETMDLALITQESADDHQVPGGWQKPYDPHLLDEAGSSGRPVDGRHQVVGVPARVAFFFHFLRLDRPLLTPAGPRLLPRPTPRPERLRFMTYSL
jgi:hypothetical protein